jgi:recyclin-1
MNNYKPEDSPEGTSNPPLLEYLELVNVVDTVTSILQVYFDKDLVSSEGHSYIVADLIDRSPF